MAVLAGSMYRRAGCGVDARGVPDVTGCLFIICTSALFSSFFPCIGLIGKSMPLAYRESAGGLYEISAHLLVAYAGAGLGYCLPAVLPVEVALIVAPVVVYPCILFGGLYERSVDIPWYFAWWNSAVLEFYGLGNLSFSASCWSLLAVGTGLRVFVFAYLELHAAWAKRG
ncbi:ATPase [Aureococcus anophagefferens]|nr:ATPase [Aureococcus anophagefferens]